MSGTAVDVPGGAPADAYVERLGRRLQGPPRVRRDMLREVRDGLDDAAAALAAEGLDREEAQRLAVAGFGPVDELAAGLQPELAARQARWTACWGFAVPAALHAAWDAAWATGPDTGPAPPAVAVLSVLVDVLGLSTAAACLAVLLVVQVRGRRLRRPERLARLLGRAVAAGLLGVLAASLAMTVVNTGPTSAVVSSSPGHLAVGAVTVAAVTAVLASARRCVRTGAPARRG